MAENSNVKNEPPDNGSTSESSTEINSPDEDLGKEKGAADMTDIDSTSEPTGQVATKQETEQEWLYCEDCGKSLQSAVSMEMHKMYSCNKKKKHKFKCKICGKKLRSKETVKLHMKTMHSEDKEKPPNFRCHLCDKTYKVKHRLTHHIHIIHSQKNYSCDKCNKGFASEKLVEKHIEKVHSDREKVSCPKCSQLFATPHSMQRHLTTQHRRCKCLLCGQRFFTVQNGHEHMSSVHIGQQPPFKCTICVDYVEENRKEYEKHMYTHIADMSHSFPIRNYMNQKPLKCLLCGRRVDWQTSEKHIRDSHIPDEAPYKCLICQYSDDAGLYLYDDAESLVKHLTSHVALVENTPSFSAQKLPSNAQDQSSTFPYKCLLCHKRLPDIKAGISHMRSDHLPESASSLYCCTICQYTDLKHPGKYEYTDPENFVEHLLIHLVKAKCNVSQPSPTSQQNCVKEEMSHVTQNGACEISPADEARPAQSIKMMKTVKTMVKTQRGVKTKALMRSKLQEKAMAKKQALKQEKQLTKPVVSAKQTGKWKQVPKQAPKSVEIPKQFKGLSGVAPTPKRDRHFTNAFMNDSIEDLQAAIDPFEFTDKEFDTCFILDHVMRLTNEDEAADDDIPLSELANQEKPKGRSYMKAVNFQTQKVVKRAAQTKHKAAKQDIVTMAKPQSKTAGENISQAKTKSEKLTNVKNIPHKTDAKTKVIKKRLNRKTVELEKDILPNNEKFVNAETNLAVLQNKKDKIKKEPTNRDGKLPQQVHKQKIKVKQNEPEKKLKEKLQKQGTRLTKRKGWKDTDPPAKRRKTRLSKKLAKEAKKTKTKHEGPSKKTILSSKDMLDILEDVKNESKMKKKKKNKKMKNGQVEKEEKVKSEIGGKRKGTVAADDKNVPCKKRKVVKRAHKSQEKEEKDSVAETIDQVARGKVEKTRRPRVPVPVPVPVKSANMKLKIRLKGKANTIGATKKTAIKRIFIKKNAAKGRARAKLKKESKQNKPRQTKAKQAVSKTTKAETVADKKSTILENIQEPDTAEKNESTVQNEVKRNPKIKTTDEVKKHMKKGNKLKSPPVYDDGFRDAKLKLSVSPKKDDRLAKLIASVAKSLHMEVEIEGGEQPSSSDNTNSLGSEKGSAGLQTKTPAKRQHVEIKKTDTSVPPKIKVESANVKSVAEIKKNSVSPKMTGESEVAPTQDNKVQLNGSPDAKEIETDKYPSVVDVKKETFVNGNEPSVGDSAQQVGISALDANVSSGLPPVREKLGNFFFIQSDETEAKTVLVPVKSIKDEKFRYKCEVCGRRYMQEYNYQRHVLCHSGENPYTCNICDASYSCPGTLEKHKRTHTGEKPYKCTVCGRGFTQSTNRNRHMMTHTGLKPWKCPTCGKGFQQKIHVEAHLSSVHSVTSQYTCSVCKREFTRPDALKRHLRIHTGERPFSCSFCPKTFGRKECLKTHVASYHSKAAQSGEKSEGTADGAPVQLNQEEVN